MKEKWAAKLDGVCEVSLRGAADLAYWQERLADEHLDPVDHEGRAQVLIIAAEGRFKGIGFRELSFSILAAPRSSDVQGAFLVQAFNSRRFFAFCERWLFDTPYDYGDVRVSTAHPASIQLLLSAEPRFFLEMRSGVGGAQVRVPSHTGAGGWEGPVFLPTNRRRGSPPKFFVARVAGDTEAYPFDLEEDWCSMHPGPPLKILQALCESHFTPQEWLIRKEATHCKSKTYKRSEYF